MIAAFLDQPLAGAQLCGNNSVSRVMGCSAMRERTSRNQVKGSIPARWQVATKLRRTAAVLPPWSLPKKIQLLRLSRYALARLFVPATDPLWKRPSHRWHRSWNNYAAWQAYLEEGFIGRLRLGAWRPKSSG